MFRPGLPPRGLSGQNPGRSKNGGLDFSSTLFNGSGRALGLDLLAQKKFGPYTGWISYTLGSVRESFPNIQ